MTLVTPEPTINRDRYGRPLVTPTNGGKAIAYTRATTFIDVLEDKFNLQKWMQRQVALGLASRPDLLLSVQAHRDDKRELDRICDNAREASAASAKATIGTALHALTELIDRGEKLPEGLAANVLASLDAYVEATKDFKATHIEQFVVQDMLKVGGTPDRIVQIGRKKTRYIADIKTGSIEFGALKIAQQLALYARSKVYDVATGARDEHGADIDRGLIIHLPAVEDPSEARCDLHWIDLKAGWNAVLVSRQVREERKHKFSDLTERYNPAGVTTLEQLEASVPLVDQIKACADAESVRALWAAHEAEWTEELTVAARAHIGSMREAL